MLGFSKLAEVPHSRCKNTVPAFRISLINAALATSMASFSALSAETVAYTPPLGGMSFTVHGGTGTAPATTPLALPISDTPSAVGAKRARITAINASTVTSTSAGWTDSALANATFPYDVRLLQGTGTGARLAITANTTDTVTLSGRDLNTLGVNAGSDGDIFELVPVDTLDSLFAADTFLGGAAAADADLLHLAQSTRSTFFYDTAASRWTDSAAPTGDAGISRLPPEGSVSVERKGEALTLRFVGAPAQSNVNVLVANSGPTYTHTGFPRSITLGDLALQTKLTGWVSHAAAEQADLVGIAAGASWVFYFHNGADWQRSVGATTTRDDVVIPAGQPIQIFRRGSASGSTALVINHPSNSR